VEIPHGTQISLKYSSSHQQALIIKERDIDYQGLRMCTMRRFLRAFPYAKERLQFEASKDIPPVYRAKIWAAMLDVYPEDTSDDFVNIDCISEQVSDRQLKVDIPRCHQYEVSCFKTVKYYY
jgi:TBC domain-containing protein kinase-like protein